MSASIHDTSIHRPVVIPSAYDDFPYLWTRIVRGLYHIIPLPSALDKTSLKALARVQSQCNRLPTCLVMGPHECVYFDLDGAETVSDQIPSGGIIVSEKLKPCAPLEQTTWWEPRSHRLRTFGLQKKSGFLLGDPTKGGRKATPDELEFFAGSTPHGIPKGLVRCSVCSDWKGRCLDPSAVFHGYIMSVVCRCDNDNRCARCYQPLAERKLNANFYCESDRGIWHVPGFMGLSHRCDSPRISSMVQDAAELKKGHAEIKKQVQNLLRALRKAGVLNKP